MTLMLVPMISADAIPGAVSWRVKARARPEITLADASRCDVSRCKFVQPFFPVDCVVSETGEADMMVGKITLTIAGGSSTRVCTRFSRQSCWQIDCFLKKAYPSARNYRWRKSMCRYNEQRYGY